MFLLPSFWQSANTLACNFMNANKQIYCFISRCQFSGGQKCGCQYRGCQCICCNYLIANLFAGNSAGCQFRGCQIGGYQFVRYQYFCGNYSAANFQAAKFSAADFWLPWYMCQCDACQFSERSHHVSFELLFDIDSNTVLFISPAVSQSPVVFPAFVCNLIVTVW